MPSKPSIADRLRNVQKETLSDAWYRLYRYTYEYRRRDGNWEEQRREVFDRGNGAAVLLYDPRRRCVLLTRQFRMPTFLNRNPEGLLIEACAGVLEESDPEACILREILEETGYRLRRVEKVMEAYTSPGALTELMHLYQAPYSPEQKEQDGGGVAEETEDIELLEYSYAEVLEAMRKGEIRDAKTLLLLQHAALYGPLRETAVSSGPAPR